MKIVNAFAGLGYLASSKSFKAIVLRTAIWNAMRFLLNRPKAFTILQNFEDRDFAVSNSGMSEDNTEVIMGSGVDLEMIPAISAAFRRSYCHASVAFALEQRRGRICCRC